MNGEQRFSPADLVRVNIELDVRDVHATWSQTDEIIVRGIDVDALIQADELFITSEAGRRNNPGPVEVELPERPIQCAFKIDRGDIHLSNAQDRIEVSADSGDVTVNQGTGSLTIASGKGDANLENYHGEVVLSSGSGDKTLRDIFGDVTIRSGKGDMHLSGGSGRTTIAIASGDVQVRDRHCAELTIAGASGDISVNGGSLGRTTISTASGDIRCQSTLAVATYDFTASSGDISISIPRDLPARVDAATTRGSVNTDLPLVAIAQRGPRNPHGKRLVGSTSEAAERAGITLRTSSGDISINWAAHAASPTESLEPPPTARHIDVRRPSDAGPVATTESDEVPVMTITAQEETTESNRESSADGDDRERAILSALRDGAISIEEAAMLLDALKRAPAGTNRG